MRSLGNLKLGKYGDKFKRWLGLSLKFFVSGGLLWFLLSKPEFEFALGRLERIEPDMLVLAVALICFQAILGGMRWEIVNKAIAKPLGIVKAVRVFYVGMFFNQALPSSIGGDTVRIYIIYRAGLTLASAVNAVLLERVAVFVSLVIMTAIVLPFFFLKLEPVFAQSFGIGVGVLSLATVAGLIVLMAFDRLPASLLRLRIVRGLASLSVDARTVFTAFKPCASVLGWSLFSNFNIALVVYFIAVSLKIDVTLIDCVALTAPVFLVTALPISIGGWGLREGAMVAGFGLIGVPSGSALLMSLLVGSASLVASIPGGVLWLFSSDRRARRLMPDMLPAAETGAPAETCELPDATRE